MDFSDCIKAMMKSCRMTQADLAAKSQTYQQAISNAFKRNNTEVRTLVKWCDLCGYEVVIQPKNIRGKRPEGQFVIESAGLSKDQNGKKGGESE